LGALPLERNLDHDDNGSDSCGGGGKNPEFILEERSTRCPHRSRRPILTTPFSNVHAIFVKQSGSLVQKLGEFNSK
jgi:hypothetical protein